jgi:hypothetical protein
MFDDLKKKADKYDDHIGEAQDLYSDAGESKAKALFKNLVKKGMNKYVAGVVVALIIAAGVLFG